MKILVTGGASGLGKSIVESISQEPTNEVFFTYNSSSDAANDICSRLHSAKAIKCDFRSREEIEHLNQFVSSTQLDVLILNAHSGFTKNYFHKLDVSEFLVSFERNIIPAISIAQVAIRGFRKRKFGKIITILSSAILDRPPIGWSEYVAQKTYMYALVKSWAVENAPFNITSNAISPSFMRTALTGDTDERLVEQMERNHPLKVLLTTDEVASSVKYLLNASQQINGTNFIINAAENVI